MRVGYARTSTIEQVAGLEAQVRDLTAAQCERIFQEQVSSVDSSRPQLEAALAYVRDGDTFVVTKIDRLARSIAHLIEIEGILSGKGAALSILDPAMDTSKPAGRLTFNIFGAVAQFEREIMLARQREGIAKAQAAGKYKGRKPTAREKSKEVQELSAQGVGPSEIAERLGMHRTSVWRILQSNQ